MPTRRAPTGPKRTGTSDAAGVRGRRRRGSQRQDDPGETAPCPAGSLHDTGADQGTGRDGCRRLNPELVRFLSDFATGPMPDLTFLIDIGGATYKARSARAVDDRIETGRRPGVPGKVETRLQGTDLERTGTVRGRRRPGGGRPHRTLGVGRVHRMGRTERELKWVKVLEPRTCRQFLHVLLFTHALAELLGEPSYSQVHTSRMVHGKCRDHGEKIVHSQG